MGFVVWVLLVGQLTFIPVSIVFVMHVPVVEVVDVVAMGDRRVPAPGGVRVLMTGVGVTRHGVPSSARPGRLEAAALGRV
jgi:hypothetical protein